VIHCCQRSGHVGGQRTISEETKHDAQCAQPAPPIELGREAGQSDSQAEAVPGVRSAPSVAVKTHRML
jgi:hypothetical protein